MVRPAWIHLGFILQYLDSRNRSMPTPPRHVSNKVLQPEFDALAQCLKVSN